MSDLNQETKVPSIPSLDNIQDVNVRNVLAAMKELLEVREGLRPKGDDLDANVTFRDLYNAGFAGVNVGGQIVTNPQVDNQLVQPVAGSGGDTIINNTTIIEGGTPPDLTIPSAPSGLVATGTKLNVIVEWTHISDANHSHVEIWRSASNNLGLGVKIGTSDGDIYADAIGNTGVTYYYWIRAVSKADIAGSYNAGASSGTSATTGQIASGDLISVDGAKIVDATIVNAKIYDLSATKITSGRIGATESVEVGTGSNKVVIDGLGNVRMGATGYATGSGFWIGENAGLSKLYLGTPTEYIKYNGNNLEIETSEFKLTTGGNAEFSGNLDAPSGTLGQITIGTTGHIKGGQTAYNTGSGFFLGYDASAPANYKFSIGNPAGQYITWDGVEMLSNGLAKLGGIAIYDIAGTYTFTVPANVDSIYVVMCVGGGGGGTCGFGSGSTQRGGGGGGGEVKEWVKITGLVFNQDITITVGAGGVRNSSPAGGSTPHYTAANRGGAGGVSSVGSYVTSLGGEGGYGNSNSGTGAIGGWQGRPASPQTAFPSASSFVAAIQNIYLGTGSTPDGGWNTQGRGARLTNQSILEISTPSNGGGGYGRISDAFLTETNGASGKVVIIW